jgi:hypothetical protein
VGVVLRGRQGSCVHGVELMQRDDQRWIRHRMCFTHQAVDKAEATDNASEESLAYGCDMRIVQVYFLRFRRSLIPEDF